LQGQTSELMRYARLTATPDDPAPAHLLVPCLLVRLNAASSTGQAPRSWKISLVTPVFRTRDVTDTANYCPVLYNQQTVCWHHGTAPGQIYQTAIAVVSTSESPSTGVGTFHPASSLQHVIGKHRHVNSPLYLCFVDLTSCDKAYRQWKRLFGAISDSHMLCGNLQTCMKGSLA